MRSVDPQKTLVTQEAAYDGRHSVLRVLQTLLRIPKMMRDELQQQRLGGRPGQGMAGGSQAPGLQIGEVGGQRPQRVFAHSLVDEVPQRFDVLVREQFGKLVAPVDRKHGGDRVQRQGSAIDRILAMTRHAIDDAG